MVPLAQGIAQLAEGRYVPRSSCLNLALLRKLIVSSSGPAKDRLSAGHIGMGPGVGHKAH